MCRASRWEAPSEAWRADGERIGKEPPPHPWRRASPSSLSPPCTRRGCGRGDPDRGWGEATVIAPYPACSVT
jgi:hypothetical protein